MKARVRTGELILWTCPGCGAKRWIEYATLYHQMEDHVMIWYTPNDPTEAIKHFETVKRGGDPEVIADAVESLEHGEPIAARKTLIAAMRDAEGIVVASEGEM